MSVARDAFLSAVDAIQAEAPTYRSGGKAADGTCDCIGPKGDKGEPGKDAVVDATLTQSGQAADAKATGDVVSQLKNDNYHQRCPVLVP